MQQLLDCGILVTNDVVGYYVVQLRKFVFDATAFARTIHLVCRESQSDDVRRRKIRQVHLLGQCILPLGNSLGEYRLGDARCDEGAVDDLAQLETLFESRHNFVLHKVDHLERYARQRYDHLVLLLEPHTRCCAVCVVQHGAPFGHHCLRTVQFVEGNTATGEHRADVLRLALVVAHIGVKIAC